MALSRKSRRIDILASTLGVGGAERVVEALARGLPAHGYPVRILCLHGAGAVGADIMRGGTPVVDRIARFRRDPFVLPRLVSLMREERDGALLCVDHHDAVFCGALAALLVGRTRRVLMIHSTGLWGRRSSFTPSDRAVLPLYGRIVALARAHAGYLVEREGIDGGKVRVINNGIDAGRFAPAAPAERERLRAALGVGEGSFVVSIVAGLRPEKNHEMFLAAAAGVAAVRNDFVFLIVGEGEEAEKLHEKARDLGLEGVVRFLGRRGDVAAILGASDASVLCSHPVVETFPIAVLEAMAAGVPVVATDVGAVREMLVDGSEGFIVPSGDADSLVRALIGLAGSAETRRAVGERARERVARDFTIERMVQGYADLFGEMPV